MADATPFVELEDGTARMATPADRLLVRAGLPTRYIEGLMVEHAFSQPGRHVRVWPGSCRNAVDTADIVLANETTADVDIAHSSGTGLPLLNGMDEIGLDNLITNPITCSQTLYVITASGNVIPHYKPKNLIGTISTVGTALTGTGTKFLTALTVGDLVGSSTTYGFAFVLSVQSDTAATLVVALPGGDATTIAAQVINLATIWAGTSITNKQSVKSINAAGTSITVFLGATVAGSSPLTIGVAVDNDSPDDYSYYSWYYVYAIDDGTTPGVLVSTQHQEPLALPAGYTSYRRIGSVLWFEPEDDTGYFFTSKYLDGGQVRFCEAAASWLSLTVPATQYWYPEAWYNWLYPRTARKVLWNLTCANGSQTTDATAIYYNTREVASISYQVARVQKVPVGHSAHLSCNQFEATVDDGGGFKTVTTGQSGGLTSFQLIRQGFYDVL